MFGMPQIIFLGPVIRTDETIEMRRMLCGLRRRGVMRRHGNSTRNAELKN
jgi:hypothetical protein